MARLKMREVRLSKLVRRENEHRPKPLAKDAREDRTMVNLYTCTMFIFHSAPALQGGVA